MLFKKGVERGQTGGKGKVESIGKWFQYLNTLLIPVLVIIFGFWYSRKRKQSLKGDYKIKTKINRVAATGGQNEC